jgi:hypothetical protein
MVGIHLHVEAKPAGGAEARRVQREAAVARRMRLTFATCPSAPTAEGRHGLEGSESLSTTASVAGACASWPLARASTRSAIVSMS